MASVDRSTQVTPRTRSHRRRRRFPIKTLLVSLAAIAIAGATWYSWPSAATPNHPVNAIGEPVSGGAAGDGNPYAQPPSSRAHRRIPLGRPASAKASGPTSKKPSASARATSPTATTPATVGGPFEDQVIALTNNERTRNGCGAVTENAKLTNAAQGHSADMAEHGTMSHTGSDGSSPWDRTESAGYSNAIGENVAYGYATPQAVVDAWMNSEGHRRNILNCSAKAIGVGLAKNNSGTPYWTQVFGSTA